MSVARNLFSTGLCPGLLTLALLLSGIAKAQSPAAARGTTQAESIRAANSAKPSASITEAQAAPSPSAQQPSATRTSDALGNDADATGQAGDNGSNATAGQGPGVSSPTPAYKPERCDITQLGRCVKDLLEDEVGMWTSPLRLRERDALWLVPLGAATGAALATDSRAQAALGYNPSRIRFSVDYSNAAGEYGPIGAAGGLYLLGLTTHNETARETGVLSLESAIDVTVVVEALKLATNRLRPNVPPGTGPFWPDDKFTTSGSFPSGHAALAFAFAHVVSQETPGKTWLHLGMYALATSVAVTRVTGQEHFPADVVAGSAIGYLIGGYVYRHHSEAGGREGLPVNVFPFSDARTHSVGVGITLDSAALRVISPERLAASLAHSFQ